MIREVRAHDGRNWTVRSEINWSKPTLSDQEFEHDVAAGQVAGIAMLLLVIMMMLMVVFFAPAGVYFPGWLKLAVLALLLVMPVQWALSRPWTIVAETHEPLNSSGEHWVGTVRGAMAARQETTRAARHLEEHAVPDDGAGPLQPVP